MYDLIPLSETAFVVECPSRIGIVKVAPDEVVLIDSGNHKDTGKRVLKILDEHGWRLQAVYNTHFHADHIGGNRIMQARTGCAVYAPGAEQVFVHHPELEPAFLYGAAPPESLCNRFLLAEASQAICLEDAFLPKGLCAVPLPGHTPCMTGYRTQDGVFYIADSVCGGLALEKYRVFYLYDVPGYLRTLDLLEQTRCDWFVPSHAPATRDIRPLVQRNREAVAEISQALCAICRRPLLFDELLAELFAHYALKMDMTQYALVGSAVHAYLAYLMRLGRVTAEVDGCRLVWKAAD